MSSSKEKENCIREAFHRLAQRLRAIAHGNPAKAIAEARALRPEGDLDEANIAALRAAIFIDEGSRLSDAQTVAEGIDALRGLQKSGSYDAEYNIANGLSSLAKLKAAPGLQGLLDTADLRLEARTLFHKAAEHGSSASIKSAAFNNQGNLLKDSYRWVEAYDAYVSALEHDGTNAIALSGVINLLHWRFRRSMDSRGALRRAAIRYAARAQGNLDQAEHYAGLAGVRRVEELIRELRIDPTIETPEDESSADSPYLAFVRTHRLALCIAPESAGESSHRWDHLTIKSINEPLASDHRVPTVFAAWNLLKADFLAARWLAYTAVNHAMPETGLYADTLDHANYGSRHAALVLAQKAALDILDKIAVAATHYLNLGGSRKSIYFGTRWHVMDAKNSKRLAIPVQWQPDVGAEILAGNEDLYALAELAHDYSVGHVHSKKELRNSGTHRFVVLHDTLMEGYSRPSDIIERYTQEQFERMVVESLQIVRAGLMYFRGAISQRERRLRQRSGVLSVPVQVYDHHVIRGDERTAADT